MSVSKDSTTRTIEVGALARVEGEGALHVNMRDGQVDAVRLEIYEPPRFFEALLRGRGYAEVPDITARICGICPVAYQMGSCHALERAMGVFDEVDPWIRSMRDLLYCGEWIESHVLHMFMLHLPDFFGYESAISMAEDFGPTVKTALRIKKVGNQIVTALGGRSVHPVGVRVGGFYRAMQPAAAEGLLVGVKAALEEMKELSEFLAKKVEYPEFDRDYEFLALRHESQYPMNLGRIVSSRGLNIDQESFLDAIQEQQVPHSTAFHATIKERGSYLVGPLARLNLNAECLHPIARETAEMFCKSLEKSLPWRSSFLSLPARAIETVHALALAADTLAAYRLPDRSFVPIEPVAGIGGHGTEAPRGICWHQYATNDDGTIASARIIPPTSQNQMTIEEDLRLVANEVATLSDEDAALRCEQVIRNYDPCISCSVHFLKFERSWSTSPGTQETDHAC